MIDLSPGPVLSQKHLSPEKTKPLRSLGAWVQSCPGWGFEYITLNGSPCCGVGEVENRAESSLQSPVSKKHHGEISTMGQL
jgi:hypothetical protein